VGQTGLYSFPSAAYGHPTKAHARRITYTDKQRKIVAKCSTVKWAHRCLTLRATSPGPHPYPPVPATRRAASGAADTGAHSLDFAGTPRVGGSYFFSRLSSQIAAGRQLFKDRKRSNGDSGSPIWPATARPARTVGRGPVVVLQEGALRR
jgi:hypothetical protein